MSIIKHHKGSKDQQFRLHCYIEVFKDLHDRHSKPGVMIQGLRYRENMTQAELAKRIKITQGDLSKIENGKRPIGKEIARRLDKLFKSDYRIFL